MLPGSYAGLKIVHDQMIQEALEHRDTSAEPVTQKRGLLQVCGAFLAHFTNHSAQEPKAAALFCDQEGEEVVS